MRFFPINYKKDFEFVRTVDDSFDPRFFKAAKAKPERADRPTSGTSRAFDAKRVTTATQRIADRHRRSTGHERRHGWCNPAPRSHRCVPSRANRRSSSLSLDLSRAMARICGALRCPRAGLDPPLRIP